MERCDCDPLNSHALSAFQPRGGPDHFDKSAKLLTLAGEINHDCPLASSLLRGSLYRPLTIHLSYWVNRSWLRNLSGKKLAEGYYWPITGGQKKNSGGKFARKFPTCPVNPSSSLKVHPLCWKNLVTRVKKKCTQCSYQPPLPLYPSDSPPKDWTGLFTFTLPPVTPSREEPRFPLEEKRYWNKESLSEHYPWTWSLGVFFYPKKDNMRSVWKVVSDSTSRFVFFLYSSDDLVSLWPSY